MVDDRCGTRAAAERRARREDRLILEVRQKLRRSAFTAILAEGDGDDVVLVAGGARFPPKQYLPLRRRVHRPEGKPTQPECLKAEDRGVVVRSTWGGGIFSMFAPVHPN